MEVPAHWSAAACDVFDARCLLADGVPARLRPVAEDDVPRFLWRHVPDSDALAAMPPNSRTHGEASARAVFDRIAGGWTYTGWKGGYFDSEADAQAFFDEMRILLCRQIVAPEIAVWRTAGLWWAYGIPADGLAGCVVDHRTGGLVAAGPAHVPPAGAFIHGVVAEATAEGGVFDLWRRDAMLLAAGLGSGANLSCVDRDDGPSLLDCLRLGDGAAALFRDPDLSGSPARTVVVDAAHPEARAFAGWKGREAQTVAALYTGSAIVERHVTAIVEACRRDRRRPSFDPARNPALRFAILAARQAMVPDAMIERAIALVQQGRTVAAGDANEPLTEHGSFATASGQGGRHLLRADDTAMGLAAGLPRDDADNVGGTSLLETVADAAWSAGATGLLFESATEAWNTCAASGEIRAVAGDGDFAFLDDTACGRAVLNLGGFLGPDGFDATRFAHVARLATLALDIAIAMTALPSPLLARRCWNFRAIGVGLTNLGGALMAEAIPYDSEAGRAVCAAACALMTGTAYATSAEIAEELGAFPAFAQNRENMLRVIANHACGANGAMRPAASGEHPVTLRHEHCPCPTLIEAVRTAWATALAIGSRAGFRNAQVSLIAPAEAESTLLDCTTRGIAPAGALVRYERLPGTGFRKAILPAVTQALKRLGYGETAGDAITRHIAGHRTLSGAPGVNHEHLLRRGFTERALETVEAALEDAPDIRFAFDRWTLGDRFCTDMLGFTTEEIDDPAFDMLSALGFSDAAIEAANAYCCGADTPEGAPYLEPDHLSIFDCPRPLGDRGRRRLSASSQVRMMAAAQPFVSGGIGHAVPLPGTATVADIRDAMLLAWRLGLKAITVDRDDVAVGESYAVVLPPASAGISSANARFAVVDGDRAATESAPPHARRAVQRVTTREAGGVSQALSIARAVKGFGDPAQGPVQQDYSGTVVGGNANASADAKTSRRRSSHAARSTASVPSSADAVVEQRQV